MSEYSTHRDRNGAVLTALWLYLRERERERERQRFAWWIVCER